MELINLYTVILMIVYQQYVGATHCTVDVETDGKNAVQLKIASVCQCIGYNIKSTLETLMMPNVDVNVTEHGLTIENAETVCLVMGYTKPDHGIVITPTVLNTENANKTDNSDAERIGLPATNESEKGYLISSTNTPDVQTNTETNDPNEHTTTPNNKGDSTDGNPATGPGTSSSLSKEQENFEATPVFVKKAILICLASLFAGIFVAVASKFVYDKYRTKSYELPENQKDIELQLEDKEDNDKSNSL